STTSAIRLASSSASKSALSNLRFESFSLALPVRWRTGKTNFVELRPASPTCSNLLSNDIEVTLIPLNQKRTQFAGDPTFSVGLGVIILTRWVYLYPSPLRRPLKFCGSGRPG